MIFKIKRRAMTNSKSCKNLYQGFSTSMLLVFLTRQFFVVETVLCIVRLVVSGLHPLDDSSSLSVMINVSRYFHTFPCGRAGGRQRCQTQLKRINLQYYKVLVLSLAFAVNDNIGHFVKSQ